MAVTRRGGSILPWVLSGLFFAAATTATSEASGVTSMITGGLTSQPIGHYDFCQVNLDECTIQLHDRGPLVMTDDVRKLVETVNLAVNREVKPLSDWEIYGKEEVWAYPDAGVGDCEDYVLEKRRRLMQHGISLSNLLITVVRKPDGEGHAVLTVRTDRGDFILDNLTDETKLWYKTGYRYLKRQDSTHTGRWVNLRDDQNMLVGAVN
jgi:predicted transglutaminase-like cysteine proteinase